MSKITNYFKKTKSVEFDQRETDVAKNKTFAERFYRDCLKNSKPQCEKSTCMHSKNLFNLQLDEIQKKCDKRKTQIEICKSIIAEKESEIENLRKMLESEKSNTQVFDKNDKASNLSTVPLSFCTFSTEFNEEQLASLRLIGPTKREDSSFVSLALQILYDGRLDVLQTKSITGRSKPGVTKGILTPKNVTTITNIFAERLEKLNIVAIEREERKKKVNKYIKDAQNNIGKSLKINGKEVARQLDFS